MLLQAARGIRARREAEHVGGVDDGAGGGGCGGLAAGGALHKIRRVPAAAAGGVRREPVVTETGRGGGLHVDDGRLARINVVMRKCCSPPLRRALRQHVRRATPHCHHRRPIILFVAAIDVDKCVLDLHLVAARPPDRVFTSLTESHRWGGVIVAARRVVCVDPNTCASSALVHRGTWIVSLLLPRLRPQQRDLALAPRLRFACQAQVAMPAILTVAATLRAPEPSARLACAVLVTGGAERPLRLADLQRQHARRGQRTRVARRRRHGIGVASIVKALVGGWRRARVHHHNVHLPADRPLRPQVLPLLHRELKRGLLLMQHRRMLRLRLLLRKQKLLGQWRLLLGREL
mmetsp:Transcript_1032/g.2668  ORF Transcript_1032/g.2668 Transcript_1032/m.2668 type:complete len:348 (-) Transcript_1032:123-1166(-)